MASSVFNIITSLVVLLWLSCMICENIEDCIPSIRVPRNTVWIVPEMKTLKINCTLEFDSLCGKNSTVSWCKIDDINECQPLNRSRNTETKWSKISESKSMSFLIFWSVSMEDSGLYRCKLDGPVPSVSHNINVTVTAFDTDFEVVNNENKTTNGSRSVPAVPESPWPYVYICCGILSLVLLVTAVALLITWCQKSKQSGKKIYQSSDSQMSHFTSPERDIRPPGNTHSLPVQLSPPSDCIYDNAPVRASSERHAPPRRHPVNHTARPGQSHERFNVEDNDEESPLVYASLNHTTPRGPVRVNLPEETSEYAAIRVS